MCGCIGMSPFSLRCYRLLSTVRSSRAPNAYLSWARVAWNSLGKTKYLLNSMLRFELAGNESNDKQHATHPIMRQAPVHACKLTGRMQLKGNRFKVTILNHLRRGADTRKRETCLQATPLIMQFIELHQPCAPVLLDETKT